jgi:hypothetical protein
MSLVGSLEDLGLGDILQIVSLSRKSGVLVLRSGAGTGQIVLSDGFVRGASIKGEPEDLRGLLATRGLVTDEEFDRAVSQAGRSGASLEDTVVENTGVDAEQIESLRRDHVERAVMRMFLWRSGEFSFEVRDAIDADEDELFLSTGINIQYLAMEATRLRDESGGPTLLPEVVSDDTDTDGVPLFSGEAEECEVDHCAEEARDPVGALALATVRYADAEGEETSPGDADPPEAAAHAADARSTAAAEEPEAEPGAAPPDDPVESGVAPDAVAAAAAEFSTDAPAVEDVPGDPTMPVVPQVAATAVETGAEFAPAHSKPVHLVAIDPSLAGLEWFKASVDGMFRQVHIFQRSEIGIERIRRYLGRGIVPLVVLSPDASGDPMTDVRDVGELIQRLRTLAPQISIVALVEEGTSPSLLRGVDCVVERPTSPGLDSEQWQRHEVAAQRLRKGLAPWAGTNAAGATQVPRGPKSQDLEELREVSARLRDPSIQGDVLSVVLDFAAECFSRVAIFVIRDEVAAGLAQRGIARAGGPGDEELGRIEFDAEVLPELFRTVLERRASVRSSMEKTNDHRLAMLIGTRSPSEAYAAPIESGGCVVALLYADNLPDERPLADTTGLEIALHEAGLALDRALLERTLANSGNRG